MKFWIAKEGSETEVYCKQFLADRQKIHDERDKLVKSLLGARRKTDVVHKGDRFTGMSFIKLPVPDLPPDERLKLAKDTADGHPFYVPHKRTKASKELAHQMEKLSDIKPHRLCKMLGIESITFVGLTMRFNTPIVACHFGRIYMGTIDEFKGHSSIERVSDVEYDAIIERQKAEKATNR